MKENVFDFQVINLCLSQKALSQGPLKYLLLLSFNTFALWSLFKGRPEEVQWSFNEYFYYLVFTGNSLKLIFSDFVLFSFLPLLHLHFHKATSLEYFPKPFSSYFWLLVKNSALNTLHRFGYFIILISNMASDSWP